jgi:two-component system sensor histidine kinase MtrB
VQTLLFDSLKELNERGGGGALYGVLLTGSPRGQVLRTRETASEAEVVPPALVERLSGGTTTAYVFAEVDGPRGPQATLITGSVLRTDLPLGDYRLYHLFPLTSEEQTLSLVRRTAAAAGLLLVGLLALIAGPRCAWPRARPVGSPRATSRSACG